IRPLRDAGRNPAMAAAMDALARGTARALTVRPGAFSGRSGSGVRRSVPWRPTEHPDRAKSRRSDRPDFARQAGGHRRADRLRAVAAIAARFARGLDSASPRAQLRCARGLRPPKAEPQFPQMHKVWRRVELD